jgi:hypothetical protein
MHEASGQNPEIGTPCRRLEVRPSRTAPAAFVRGAIDTAEAFLSLAIRIRRSPISRFDRRLYEAPRQW